MKPGLSLRVSQHLALTPQLQQSIRLLQLSTLELAQEVEQMLDDNPFLEADADSLVRDEFGLAQADTPVSSADKDAEFAGLSATDSVSNYDDRTAGNANSDSPSDASSDASSDVNSDGGDMAEPSWEGDGTVDMRADDAEWGGDAPARQNSGGGDDEFDALDVAKSHESLTAYLHRQALGLRLNPTDQAALRFLIESLNEDGYLEDSLQSLAEGLAGDDVAQVDDLVHHFTVARGLLQSLDPTGVGATDLGECLRLQLREWLATPLDAAFAPDAATVQVALSICQQPIDFLARRDVKRLVQRCSESEANIKLALNLITRLEPRPGRRFTNVERNFVVPDVIVARVPTTAVGQASGGRAGLAPVGQPRFTVRLNTDVMPKLRVHDIYANVLKQHRGGDSAGLTQRLQEARWFIKNIQQRFDTILRVSNAIVERQKSYFVHGPLAMRPLVLREIADELGLHESTISRVTTAKYMATPHGTVELKYFFGSGLGTDAGGNASSTAVRALIQQFVSAEDPKKPLSDSQIADMLKEQGIDCARRTVAKYRDALRIAPTNLRKAL